MNDERDDLLREIGDAVRVEPSARFAANVRERVQVRRWQWQTWVGGGAMAAAVVVFIVLLSPREMSRHGASPASGATKVPAEIAAVATPAPLEGVGEAAVSTRERVGQRGVSPAGAGVVRTEPAARRRIRAMPVARRLSARTQVIVHRDQGEWFDRLLAATAAGRVSVPESGPTVELAVAELVEPTPVAIPEIIIKQLPGEVGS